MKIELSLPKLRLPKIPTKKVEISIPVVPLPKLPRLPFIVKIERRAK